MPNLENHQITPEAFTLDVFSGQPEIRRCERKLCKKPLPENARSNQKFCNDHCRGMSWLENAIIEAAERHEKDKVNALRFVVEYSESITFLTNGCMEDIEYGDTPIYFRYHWEGLRRSMRRGNKKLLINDRWERHIKEYIKANYPEISKYIVLKKENHEKAVKE